MSRFILGPAGEDVGLNYKDSNVSLNDNSSIALPRSWYRMLEFMQDNFEFSSQQGTLSSSLNFYVVLQQSYLKRSSLKNTASINEVVEGLHDLRVRHIALIVIHFTMSSEGSFMLDLKVPYIVTFCHKIK